MNRYIIIYDDGSSSYLAHALFGKGRGVRQNHKYILKIGEGRKARYFYTPEEVAAYKRELQGVAKKTAANVKNSILASKVDKVKDKLGYDERDRRDAVRKSNERVQKVAKEEARKGIDKISKSIYEKDEQKSKELFDRGLNQRNTAWEASDRSNKKVREAQEAYDKTALGKVEKVKEFVKDKATDAELAAWKAGKKAENAKNKVGDYFYDKKLDAEIAADKLKENVTGNKSRYFAKKLREEEQEYKDRAAGVKNEAVKDAYNDAANRASEMAKKYENMADKSLVGRVGKVKSKAERMKEEFRNKKEKSSDADKHGLRVTTTDKDGNKTVYEGKDARKYIGGMIKDQAKQQVSQKTEEIKNKAGDALDSAIEPVKKAVRSVTSDIDNRTGKSYKDAADYFKKIAEQATTEEERARAKEYEGYNRKDYEKSPMGKAEKVVADAKEKVKDTAKKVAEKASDLDAKVGMKIDDTVWEASNKLNIKGKEVHDEYSKLREEYHKNPSPELEEKAEKVYQEWLKTPHGKVTNSTGGFGSNGLVGDVAWQAEKGAKKVKELSEAQAAKIREKLNDGLNVSKEDMSALWKYYTNK